MFSTNPLRKTLCGRALHGWRRMVPLAFAMDQKPRSSRWFNPSLPAWFPGWLVACVLVGVSTGVAFWYGLKAQTWKEFLVFFAFGFGMTLAILSLASLKSTGTEARAGLFPPAWVGMPVLAALFGFALYQWVVEQFWGPPPAVAAGPGIAPWLLLAGATWFACRLLWWAWNVLRIVRTAGQEKSWPLSALTLAVSRLSGPALAISLLAGGVVAYALVVVCWPEARQGWPNLLAWVTILPGALVGVVIDSCLSLSTDAVVSWFLARHWPRYREQLRCSPDAIHRAAAARALRLMRRRAAPALPDLLQAVQDTSAEVRVHAGLAILWSEADDTNMALAIRPGLSDPDLRVRVVAAAILVRLQAAAPAEVLPPLTDGLKHVEAPFAMLAADNLGQLFAGAVSAVPALRAAVFERQPALDSALFALQMIGEAGVAVLVEALAHHADQAIRSTAAYLLGQMGRAAHGALPALEAALRDDSDGVRRAAGQALKRIKANGS
jgi:hypothetical protein